VLAESVLLDTGKISCYQRLLPSQPLLISTVIVYAFHRCLFLEFFLVPNSTLLETVSTGTDSLIRNTD
jgi:hypothetical protein